ncbi:hypothetical protein AG1IA_00748 [Rhizoctonia solani AG-1 IA]|uniref:Uncharacterized protein n=1 Tax=Thanatephorus cucumeris (strain AG1-IA) TaxID=983506 RepID=L8X4J7_THACA|nr:hypothetical protein AG1IA_00748 [Rhizoctonia solani AG-1 IA]
MITKTISQVLIRGATVVFAPLAFKIVYCTFIETRSLAAGCFFSVLSATYKSTALHYNFAPYCRPRSPQPFQGRAQGSPICASFPAPVDNASHIPHQPSNQRWTTTNTRSTLSNPDDHHYFPCPHTRHRARRRNG